MNQYQGSEWIKRNKLAEAGMSELGEAVANLLGDVFLGIYHLRTTALKKVDWKDEHHIELIYDNELSTTDFNELTRLVVLCHDRCIRFAIRPAGPRVLRLWFSQRKREGEYSESHPTIEKAIEVIREHYGEPVCK